MNALKNAKDVVQLTVTLYAIAYGVKGLYDFGRETLEVMNEKIDQWETEL